MKRIISLFLLFAMIMSLVLTACNSGDVPDDSTDDDDIPVEEPPSGIEISDTYKVIYNTYDEMEKKAVTDFIEDFDEKYGIKLNKQAYSKDECEYEIQLGTLKTREEYIAAKETLDNYSSAGIGVCVIKSTDKKLSVFGSTVSALEVGIKRLFDEIIADDCTYESGVDELIIFDIRKYKEKGELVGYTLDDLSKFSQASEILVNNKALTDFSPEVLEYSYKVEYIEGYPIVSVKPLSKSAAVRYEQATEENGGVATITITSGNTESVTIYKIKVDMNNYRTVDSEIVNKGGAEGMVTYVIDDGQQATATFAKSMIKKYSNLKLTFAIKVNSIATLTTKTVGSSTEYVMKNGKYTYTTNTNNINFWLDIKSTGRAEITSHTFTHAFHGTNDDGGVFEFVKNGETTIMTSESFPKGSSTKEIIAAKQVLEETGLGSGLTLIHPGIGVRTEDITVNGKKIVTYKTFFNQVLQNAIDSGKLIGSRSTFTVTNDSQLESKVTTPAIAYERRVSGVPAFMIEDYTDSAINSNPSYKSNINSWKAYIDYAREAGGWACFCIHNISNTQKGLHHIDESQADALFGYTSQLGNKIAVMNFTEATKYYHEWAKATVTSTAFRDEYITLSVTDTLDDTNYDEALTVKVYLTDGWGTGAKYQQGTTVKTLSVKSDTKGRYVLVDVVPDRGDVKILSV